MQDCSKNLCPVCTGELPEFEAICSQCGRDLHSMKRAHPRAKPKTGLYEIVPYAGKFAVALQGEVKIYDLDGADLEKVKSVVAILNQFIEGENVG